VAGGVLGAAAIVRWATRDGGDPDRDEGASVSAAPTPGGVLFLVGGAF
jgi:hypothetical protein